MFKTIFFPNKNNNVIWANAFFLLYLLLAGKVDAMVILFAYFLETIIIGIFNFIKMAIVSLKSERQKKEGDGKNAGLFQSFFFCFHYGFFVAIQSVFAFLFFKLGGSDIIHEPFDLIENYTAIFHLKNMPWALLSILAANLAYFYTNFLSDGQYHNYRTKELFILPYIRIFIQQFVVILAGFFIVLLNAGMVAAILLVLSRLALDLIIVSIKKNGELAGLLARKLSRSEKEYVQVKEALENWSE